MLSGRRKLLVADDSEAARKILKVFFGDEGYEVVAVGGGGEALRELEAEEPPDALIADAVMPAPDGYELCERVKRDERLREMPVVLLVGRFETFNEAEARRVGADTVVTKPFQSIRDLVSKVGSLLGGEPRHEERAPDAAAHGAGGETAHAEAPSTREVFAGQEAADAHVGAQGFGAEADSPYADLGDDDELIETTHADSLLGDAGSDADEAEPMFGRRRSDAPAAAADEEFTAAEFNAEEFTPAPFGAREYEHAGTNGHSTAAHAAAAASSSFHTEPADRAEETQMTAHSSFEPRAASAAAAEDTLLDLGQLEPHASSAPAAVEDDDFILDLDDMPRHSAHTAQESFGEIVMDEPSALAEASHGEHAAHFTEPTAFTEPAATFTEEAAPVAEPEASFVEPEVSFSDSTEHVSFSDSVEPVSESAVPFAASAASLSEDAASEPAHEPTSEPAHDFVMQDGPQGFASYVAHEGAASAPRGFVEPSVVPADMPAPSAVEGEFTDGSVEGDLSKAPAVSEATQSSESHAHESFVSNEAPSTAGYSVVEGHTRVEEPARAADQLSQEMIDAVARRVVEMMSDKVVREIAWEVVPELAELLIKRKLEEEGK